MTFDEVFDYLIDFRKSEGLSQIEVASRMGVGQSTVSEFESKKHTPRVGTLARYADALGLELTMELKKVESESS